jgi:hypothetical protein
MAPSEPSAPRQPEAKAGKAIRYQVNLDRGVELGGQHYPLESSGKRTAIDVEEGGSLFAAAEQLAEHGYLIRLDKPAARKIAVPKDSPPLEK